jgi:Uma2 family endonuclease
MKKGLRVIRVILFNPWKSVDSSHAFVVIKQYNYVEFPPKKGYTVTMSDAKKNEDIHYTYADFLKWDEGERVEIIDGELVKLAAPVRKHQGVSQELARRIGNFLEGKPCKLYPAPFAVRLNPAEDENDDTVLQPDIVVVCDSAKLDDNGCNGAPDLVIEILSPSTARYDRIVKFRKYQQAGVREYWIVDPDTETVQACLLENGHYITNMYDEHDMAPVAVLPGCEINLKEVFAGIE